MNRIWLTLSLFALSLLPAAALAYIGPGAGISLLGSVVGVVVIVLVAVGALLLWPIRRMLKRRRAAQSAATPPPTEPGEGS